MARRGSHHAAHEESGSRDPLMRVRTRVDAAITGVAFVVVVFEDEMPAPERSRSLHTNRGTTTDGRPFRLCEVFERPNERGRDRRSEEAKSKPTRVGFDPGPYVSSEKSADRIGCSSKRVQEVRKIRKDWSPEMCRAARTGKIRISKAYNLIRAMEKAKAIRGSNSSATLKAAKILISEENIAIQKDLRGDVDAYANKAVQVHIPSLRDKERARQSDRAQACAHTMQGNGYSLTTRAISLCRGPLNG